MKLTPLDIHHKEFRHSIRGYGEEEVDAFLDEVADEFERLFKENIDLAEKIEEMAGRLREHEKMEKTVHNTLVAAQKSAEDIEENALKKADLVHRDAELRAKEIIHEALTLNQKTQNELMSLKQAETEFRNSFKDMLEGHLERVQEIQAPAVIAAAMNVDTAEADEATVTPQAVEEPVLAKVSEPDPGPKPKPEPKPKQSVLDEALAYEIVSEAVAGQGSTPDEPQGSKTATSVQLGEIGDEGVVDDDPDYAEPAEFDMPTLGSLGERDDDLDIEEID